MNNAYHRDIMSLLIGSGHNGMRLGSITRQVYNLHTNLFSSEIDYPTLYRNIKNYLYHQSTLRRSPFVRRDRGCYAVKDDLAIQLDIFINTPIEENRKPKESEPQHHPSNARQLTLFDEF